MLVLLWAAFALGLAAPLAAEDEGLEVRVSGVTPVMAENVRSHVAGDLTSMTRTSSLRARTRYARRAEDQAVIALRPFGYYQATASAEFESTDTGWELHIAMEPGPPVLVEEVTVEIRGDGASNEALRAWRRAWSLESGVILDQRRWAAEKAEALETATRWGYLDADIAQAQIALDLERNRASLVLTLETGPRARMGEVRFEQDFIDPEALAPFPRFETGDPYRSTYTEALRTDLWKAGYFSTIDVVETRRDEEGGPVVDLRVRLERLHRATHQGTIGWGTDTEFRTQYRYQRHQLSPRGDLFIGGFAWQTRDEEVQLFGEYRLPRRSNKVRYWIVNPVYRERDERFELDVDGRDDKLAVADYRLDDFYLRLGQLTFRNAGLGVDRLQETIFVDVLSETNTLKTVFTDLALPGVFGPTLLDTGEIAPIDTNSIAIGVEWDWPRFEGRGFGLVGHRERAWLFTANESLGSDLDFTQAYVSSRWALPFGERWRLLLRGEVGYTDAEVQELEIIEGGEVFVASVTRLPARYRFRAGGSHSVRGYDFEALSNNGIGSNHIVTASAEVEMHLTGNWSVAAFVDTGNAFNDWSSATLSTGVGLGVRWYTAGFPLRLDVAQALDLDGEPWRLHFTIGSPLF